MREASARTLLENLTDNTLFAIIAERGDKAAITLNSNYADPMLCQDLNDLLKIATDIYSQRVKDGQATP